MRQPRAPRRGPLPRLAIALAVAVVGVGSALVGTAVVDATFGADGPPPITSVPADNPSLGMVYAGLSPAKKGQPCVGGYQLTRKNECTHGPDLPPAGLDVRRPVDPVVPALEAPVVPQRDTFVPRESELTADEGGFTTDDGLAVVPDAAVAAEAVVGPNGVVCEGDGTSGKRVQVLYVRAATTASRFAQFLPSFRNWSAGVDAIYDASAKDTGGSRHVRFVTTADCQVAVQEVEVPAGAMDTFSATMTALRNLGFNRTDRKYLMFGDSTVYCGIGTFAGDDRAGSVNRSNNGPSFARADSGCWTPAVASHELGHNLGAVNNSAPNSSKAGHCLDEYDVMCYNDNGGLKTTVVCTNRQLGEQRMDCNHNDYYHTNPSPGSYLATHWNVADNAFLINGGASPTPQPSPTTPAPSPTTPRPSPTTQSPAPPSPSPTSPSPTSPRPSPSSSSATPSPTVTTTPPTGLKPLRVSDTTANSTRLAWDSAGGGARYQIVLNGRSIGTVRSTRVRVMGLRPATEYRFSVAVVGANGTATPYTVTATVRTPAAVAPRTGAWFGWRSTLTDGFADLFGARSAAGTPLIVYRGHGGANQLWRLEPAGGGGFLLRSKASGLCVTPLGGKDVEGSPLVQQACDQAAAWTVTSTPFGTSLTSANGLVMGIGSSRYLGSRLLVLQRPTGARNQSWTASSG